MNPNQIGKNKTSNNNNKNRADSTQVKCRFQQRAEGANFFCNWKQPQYAQYIRYRMGLTLL